MKPQPPTPPAPPTPPQLALSLAGLVAMGLSIWIAFSSPYSIWPWLLLVVGFACAWGARRVK
jgi:hypothetical protein